MLNLYFSKKDLWLVSPLHFVPDFSRKLLLLEISEIRNVLRLFRYPVCFLFHLNFGIYHSFRVKPFSYTFSYIKFGAIIQISQERKELMGWNEKHFYHFWRTLICHRLAQTLECVFKLLNWYNSTYPTVQNWTVQLEDWEN